MASKMKSLFVCQNCGYENPKWYGKCPQCGEWDTMQEEVRVEQKGNTAAARAGGLGGGTRGVAQKISEIQTVGEHRYHTGLSEFDRVLGGGIVKGSVVLLSGDPGIGKSTILLQICQTLGEEETVLYASGEESPHQIKLRADRLGVTSENLLIMCETDVEIITEQINQKKPDIVIIDSIQTMTLSELSSSAGSITQVRECTNLLLRTAKSLDIPVIIVGHVNKDGNIAGPKVLEHIVDTVLYFEGEKNYSYRILRAAKNRFGSTNEIGVFEMTDKGLEEVANPSEMLLSGRPKNVSGNCALCTIEGTRPLIAEIQALVTPTVFPAPRRTGNGVEYNRMCLILAVLEKRLGLKFYQNDVYMNVIGGLSISEPAADLAIATALVSSLTDRVVPDDLIIIGELGLAGECRAVANPEMRVREAARLGFTRAIVPYRNVEKRPLTVEGMTIVPVKSVYEVIKEWKNSE